MRPLAFMLIAGEASGDLLGAELVGALRAKVLEAASEPTDDAQPLRTALLPEFFGAGGPKMAAAGVELAFDLTQHSVIGLWHVLKHYFKFRRLFQQLFRLALERQPDVIIGVDYGGFNLRFARAIRRYVRRRHGWFHSWNPKLVQYVSPQVWASRPNRAQLLAANHDLLLSLFPFEKGWYAARAPKLRVEFVGHPIVERFAKAAGRRPPGESGPSPCAVLLPGSRTDEVRRHLPALLGALHRLKSEIGTLRAVMVLPSEALAQQAHSVGLPAGVVVQVGRLPDALAQADVAIAKSGTITLECAFFGVPTVVFYRTSWPTYLLGRASVNVKHVAMPNLLADAEVFPEFIQDTATAGNIARAALDLLRDDARRQAVKARLAEVISSLGGPGANARAAEAIAGLLRSKASPASAP
jgi:lipid-A-disaccharide synthase